MCSAVEFLRCCFAFSVAGGGGQPLKDRGLEEEEEEEEEEVMQKREVRLEMESVPLREEVMEKELEMINQLPESAVNMHEMGVRRGMDLRVKASPLLDRIPGVQLQRAMMVEPIRTRDAPDSTNWLSRTHMDDSRGRPPHVPSARIVKSSTNGMFLYSAGSSPYIVHEDLQLTPSRPFIQSPVALMLNDCKLCHNYPVHTADCYGV